MPASMSPKAYSLIGRPRTSEKDANSAGSPDGSTLGLAAKWKR
jgi:hypothetical protein